MRPNQMAADYQWHDLVGNVGVAAIIISYFLMQLVRLHGRSLAYAATNALGAGRAAGVELDEPKFAPYDMQQLWLGDPDRYGVCLQWPVEPCP